MSKPGLYANINAKRQRIKDGSGEKMRKVGSKGSPTKKAFVQSAKTAKKPVNARQGGYAKGSAEGSVIPMKDGGKLDIQKAIKKPGSLRKSLGVKKGEIIPKSKLNKAAKKGGKLGQRARFAKTLSKIRNK